MPFTYEEFKNNLLRIQCCLAQMGHRYLVASSTGMASALHLQRQIFYATSLFHSLHRLLKGGQLEAGLLSKEDYQILLERLLQLTNCCGCCEDITRDAPALLFTPPMAAKNLTFPKDNFSAPVFSCYALNFNGIDQAVQYFQPYPALSQITIDARVRLSEDPYYLVDSYKTIYEKISDDYGLYVRRANLEGFVFFFTTADEVPHEIASGAILMGEWHRVIATYDGTTAKLFVNGQLANSAPVSGGLKNTGNIEPVSTISGYSGDDYFKGDINFIRIYDTAASESLAANAPNMDCASPLDLPGLIRRWDFQQNLLDSSGDNDHGSFLNMDANNFISLIN